jgi:uncharacterized coiled-coil protein SlyX
MTNELRIEALENKVIEQEQLLKEIYQSLVNQMQMITEQAHHRNEMQGQINSLSEAILQIGNRLMRL